MNASPTSRPSRLELLVVVVVLIVLATVPLWTQGWWTALPFATALGGAVGGRWIPWYWSPPVGFGAGALAWGFELALLPADPRARLAAVLGPADGLSGTLFLLIGPVLFGLVTAVTSTALAGALRLAIGLRRRDEGAGTTGSAASEAHP